MASYSDWPATLARSALQAARVGVSFLQVNDDCTVRNRGCLSDRIGGVNFARNLTWTGLLIFGCGSASSIEPPGLASPAPLVEETVQDAQLSPRDLDRRGDEHLLAGRFGAAIVDYDAFLAAAPEFEPQHWRRGIAYYYAQHYAKGVEQFESHRSVNPNDVENAAWHYLCKARLDGIEAAAQALLPVGPDGRHPMAEILEMFAGRVTPTEVIRAAERSKQPSALLYGYLYVGLYYEVLGRVELAGKHLRLAANQDHGSSYMGAIARMHALQY